MSSETKECNECKSKFIVSKRNNVNYKDGRKKHLYCSKKCKDKVFHRVYDKLPKQRELHRIRSRDYLRRKRERYLLKEENNYCINCGSIRNLEIHHITYNQKYNLIEILCRKCHKEVHRKLLLQ